MEDLEINKELVTEVLGKEISQIQIIGNTLNYIIPNVESQEDDELVYIDLGLNINIYEFAFKCKEWLLSKGIDITITYWSKDKVSFYSEKYHLDIEAKSGESVIIKACNWLLENNNGSI